MKTTLLDDYIMTCTMNRQVMPLYKFMSDTIKATTPVAHVWEVSNPLNVHLPDKPFDWPDPAMCLETRSGLVRGYHKFCVDVDYTEGEFATWFGKTKWYLEGALIFQQSNTSFDIVPLVREAMKQDIILNEIQLHFEFIDGRWVWCKADTGPVNPMFHDYFIERIDAADRELVDDAVNHLGNLMSVYLGSYWQYINEPGKWEINPARNPKVKMKGAKIKKIYKPASVGFKRYIQEAANVGTTTDHA